MRHILLIFFLSFFTRKNIIGQDRNKYQKDLDYLLDKLKRNYPGYNEKLNSSFFALIKAVDKKLEKDTSELNIHLELSKIALFFKDLHLRISTASSAVIDTGIAKRKYENIRLTRFDKTSDGYEGFWRSEYNDMIVYLEKLNDHYSAIIIEAKKSSFVLGSPRFNLFKITGQNFQAIYPTTNKTLISVPSYFKGGDTLFTGIVGRWIKVKNFKMNLLQEFVEAKFEPEFKAIDSNFSYLKIPKSDFLTKGKIDSLVRVNELIIANTKNLIIDIRNNTGGSWYVYKSILPYIYTNPISTTSGLFKCSEDAIAYQSNFIKRKKGISQVDSLHEIMLLDSMIKHKGDYYLEKSDTIIYKGIKKNPSRVYVLINYKSVSASELFIQFCQQSSKVTLVGEKTWGVVDFLEYIPYKSPSGKFEIVIPRLKAIFSQNKGIDNIGIAPNITVPYSENDWINYITKLAYD
jgi:hypothetical protein